MSLKLLSIGISICMLLFVIELIRRERLTFKYAILWFLLSVVGLTAAVYEHSLFRIARGLGFALPSNFIFFLISVTFIGISLALTVYICQQNSRSERIAQKIGALEWELAHLREEIKKSAHGKDT